MRLDNSVRRTGRIPKTLLQKVFDNTCHSGISRLSIQKVELKFWFDGKLITEHIIWYFKFCHFLFVILCYGCDFFFPPNSTEQSFE